MFTGIVTDIGRIESVDTLADTRVRIATAYDTGTVDLGASIACSGVCLTVVDKGPAGSRSTSRAKPSAAPRRASGPRAVASTSNAR